MGKKLIHLCTYSVAVIKMIKNLSKRSFSCACSSNISSIGIDDFQKYGAIPIKALESNIPMEGWWISIPDTSLWHFLGHFHDRYELPNFLLDLTHPNTHPRWKLYEKMAHVSLSLSWPTKFWWKLPRKCLEYHSDWCSGFSKTAYWVGFTSNESWCSTELQMEN